MKRIILGLAVVLVLIGCGDAYYDNVIGITHMDEISGETQESMGNVLEYSFENISAIFANSSTP